MVPELNNLLFTRHSIRRYKEEAVDANAVKQILEAGLLAPSSKSARPWQFVVVEDRTVLENLSQCKLVGARPLAGAAFAIAVCADPKKSDVYIEDCSVAAAYMQLQAAALGVGSCWIQLRERTSADGMPAQDLVKNELGIPSEFEVPMILTFGIPDEERRPVDPEKLMWEKVHIGSWTTTE